MKKNAIALIAFALLSSISLGFTYNNIPDDKRSGTAIYVVSDLDSLDICKKNVEGPLSGRTNKYLASWN